MHTPFRKMHGAGNDFVLLDARRPDSAAVRDMSPAQMVRLADRQRGIGCDQVIVIDHGSGGADLAVRFFNPDGSESAACGNGTRCVAALEGRARLVIGTRAGDLAAELLGDGLVRVDMGQPGLGWRDIPLAMACDTLHLPMAGDPAAASMGNPHLTFFVPALEAIDIAGVAPQIQADALLPDSANIGFARIEAPDRIRLRVYERGAGLTLACGSGACAALVNAHRRGLVGRQARLELDGGTLLIAWDAADHVLMTGPAVLAFEGSVDLAR